MLTINNIYKSFPLNKLLYQKLNNIAVLENINLDFKKGSINVINGKNGTGKTTLLRIIAGIMLPDKGSIFFDNTKLNNNLVSFISNNSRGFFLRISAFENLKYFFALNHSNFNEHKILEIAKNFDIKNKLHKPLSELSLGEIQKINLIRGTAVNSEIFIFDEAEASLDSDSKRYLVNIIKYLKDKNKIIINVSHDKKFLSDISDQEINSNNFSYEKKL